MMYCLVDVSEKRVIVSSYDLRLLLTLRKALVSYLSDHYAFISESNFKILKEIDIKKYSSEVDNVHSDSSSQDNPR